jgi:hypothetical protein
MVSVPVRADAVVFAARV